MYNKAVEKSKLSEAYENYAILTKELEYYKLSSGQSDGAGFSFLNMNIDFPAKSITDNEIKTDNFTYFYKTRPGYCGRSGTVNVIGFSRTTTAFGSAKDNTYYYAFCEGDAFFGSKSINSYACFQNYATTTPPICQKLFGAQFKANNATSGSFLYTAGVYIIP